MAEDQNWVKNLIKRYVRKLNETIRVERVIIFGSRARGDYSENSDLDLIVISPDFAGKDSLERSRFLLQTWREIDATKLRVEALGYTARELEEKKGYSPFIRKIVRDGYLEVEVA